ncbi:unnamed protein product [Prorocentrum cordatum]|uniref:Uncharacterized protein n=1 Tax=Prorocentrum cordatum TaxID=2364126 RepID=A0ABN9SQJ2_9DINO|nr:unnamed protein product [Polarella glacialis]
MARSALATACVLAALACAVYSGARAFVSAPQSPALRGDALAAAGILAAATPQAANAFTYNGKEYFDVFYGISPLYWAMCAFGIVFYGAVLKNAALKYNTPYGTTTNPDAKPVVTGKFVGMEVETNQTENYNYKGKDYINK